MARLREWMDAFPEIRHIAQAFCVEHTSFANFMDSPNGGPWLFAELGGQPVDIFSALNSGALDKAKAPLIWMNKAEFLDRTDAR